LKKCANLMRRMAREIGPISFIPHSNDAALLQKVLRWKSAQYVRTGQRDLFAIAWVAGLMEHMHATCSRGFAGRLSLLYAGDHLVAGHFGMRTPQVWHYWFPAYDVRFAKYSPGLVLLLKIAEHASATGAKHIDLGKGMSLYKERFMNARALLSYGSVEVPSLLKLRRSVGRYVWTVARRAILNSPIEGPARRLIQAHRQRSTA
jgi:CelD/BcsL family acetyltransferase involved in cellulose biosynthesis